MPEVIKFSEQFEIIEKLYFINKQKKTGYDRVKYMQVLVNYLSEFKNNVSGRSFLKISKVLR